MRAIINTNSGKSLQIFVTKFTIFPDKINDFQG